MAKMGIVWMSSMGEQRGASAGRAGRLLEAEAPAPGPPGAAGEEEGWFTDHFGFDLIFCVFFEAADHWLRSEGTAADLPSGSMTPGTPRQFPDPQNR